jgi:hypothetical protein
MVSTEDYEKNYNEVSGDSGLNLIGKFKILINKIEDKYF